MISRQADVLPVLDLERHAMLDRRFVYDVDDAIWYDGAMAQGHRFAFLKGSRYKARWLAERAHHVIAGNEILAEWLGRYATQLSVVPSLVDTDAAPQHVASERDELVIGWIGSRTTAPYLAKLRRPLELAADVTRKPIRLVTIGGGGPPVRGVQSLHEQWSPETEAAALRDMDIGVMPLPDNQWTRGKCAYKAIQYMASGVPVLADDVGVAGSVIGDGGLVLRHEPEWVEALVELVRSVSMRRQLGIAGRARAEKHFSVRAWSPHIAQIIRGR
jgi:glycosyltransferase involved in cell wall biosynthesis